MSEPTYCTEDHDLMADYYSKIFILVTPNAELKKRNKHFFFETHKRQIKSQISVFILETHYSIDIFYIIKKQFTSLRTKMKQHRMIMSKIYNLNKYILFHAIK